MVFLFCSLFKVKAVGQNDDGMIRTTDGHAIMTKYSFIAECKKQYAAVAGDSVVAKACECRAKLLNNYFTTRRLAFYQQRYKQKALLAIVDHDPVLHKKLLECGAPASRLELVSPPSFRATVVKRCVESLTKGTAPPVADSVAKRYCGCAAVVMEKRKITAERVDEATDPSALLYNEIAFQCGSPFLDPSEYVLDWKAGDSADVTGSVSVDSVTVISVFGMHKIKVTIGGTTRVWMMDSGASHLLVSKDYAKELKGKGILSDANYLGEGEYSLADNSIMKAEQYRVNGVMIGRFVLNNVILSVSEKVNNFLLGKSVLNKFSQWTLDNKNNLLILKK